MNIFYRRVHLSSILSKLSHFLLLKRKNFFNSLTKPSNISFVKRFLKFKSFQKAKASSTTSCETNRGHKIIPNIFSVTMYTRLISRMVLSTHKKSLSTATLRYSCSQKLPKIPRKLLATQQLFLKLILFMDNPF